MPLPEAINLHRTALAPIIAGLFALLGLADGFAPARIAKKLHRAVTLTLRPAESAVRRLIVFLATITHVKAQPSCPMPSGIVRGERAKSSPAFQLFDSRPRIFRPPRPPKASARAQTRISFFGAGEVRTLSLAPAPRSPGDGLETAEHLVRRLQALKAALDNLPGQARRLVRALARRETSPRLRLKGPLRPGRAPGWRKRPMQDIDHLLHQCDWLARQALPPDTS